MVKIPDATNVSKIAIFIVLFIVILPGVYPSASLEPAQSMLSPDFCVAAFLDNVQTCTIQILKTK
jgi:hypothetical protein